MAFHWTRDIRTQRAIGKCLLPRSPNHTLEIFSLTVWHYGLMKRPRVQISYIRYLHRPSIYWFVWYHWNRRVSRDYIHQSTCDWRALRVIGTWEGTRVTEGQEYWVWQETVSIYGVGLWLRRLEWSNFCNFVWLHEAEDWRFFYRWDLLWNMKPAFLLLNFSNCTSCLCYFLYENQLNTSARIWRSRRQADFLRHIHIHVNEYRVWLSV
jgi:hypothetical protein